MRVIRQGGLAAGVYRAKRPGGIRRSGFSDSSRFPANCRHCRQPSRKCLPLRILFLTANLTPPNPVVRQLISQLDIVMPSYLVADLARPLCPFLASRAASAPRFFAPGYAPRRWSVGMPQGKLESRIDPVPPSFPGIDYQQRQGGRWLERTRAKKPRWDSTIRTFRFIAFPRKLPSSPSAKS